ncbi:MAG: hypothetical protein ACTSVF_04135 [Candidatus Asgardarchaeia archaeon]
MSKKDFGLRLGNLSTWKSENIHLADETATMRHAHVLVKIRKKIKKLNEYTIKKVSCIEYIKGGISEGINCLSNGSSHCKVVSKSILKTFLR